MVLTPGNNGFASSQANNRLCKCATTALNGSQQSKWQQFCRLIEGGGLSEDGPQDQSSTPSGLRGRMAPAGEHLQQRSGLDPVRYRSKGVLLGGKLLPHGNSWGRAALAGSSKEEPGPGGKGSDDSKDLLGNRLSGSDLIRRYSTRVSQIITRSNTQKRTRPMAWVWDHRTVR